MNGWNPNARPTFVRRSGPPAISVTTAAKAPVDPWAWTKDETQGADAPEQKQRLVYTIRRLPEDRRQLAVDMAYKEGQPVRSMPYAISDAERPVAAQVMALPRRSEDSLFVLKGEQGRRALETLLASVELRSPAGRVIRAAQPYAGIERWDAGADGSQRFVLVEGRDAELIHNAGGAVVMDHDTIAMVETTIDPETAYRLATSGDLPPEASTAVAERLASLVPRAAPRAVRIERTTGTPRPRMTLDRDGETPIARIGAEYDGVAVDDLGRGGETRSYDPESGVLRVVARDARAERMILAQASTQGLEATDDAAIHRFPGQGADFDAALYDESQRDRLLSEGWTVGEAPLWNLRPRRITRMQLDVAKAADDAGYLLDVIGDGQAVEFIDPLAAIARAIPDDVEDEAEVHEILRAHVRGEDAAVRSKEGRLWIMPASEFLAIVTSLRHILTAPRGEAEPLRTDLYSIADLATISRDVGLTSPDSLTRLFNAMQSGEATPIDWPAGFAGDRDVRQLAAASWMRALFDTGYGGILADDVGYGKTIEIGLHLASLREAGLLVNGALIAAPNNAVDEWARKLSAFFPDMPYVVWHGRSRPATAEGDIVITSHDLVKRDACPLNQRSWTVGVLDEAQDAKKANGALAFVFGAIAATQKIPVTATPVENSTEDLWTLMNIANEGLLGHLPAFRKTIIEPIEKEASVAAVNRLNALTAPFQLMRIDADRPLPVIEDVVVEMTAEQKIAYNNVIALLRQRFEKRMAETRRTGRGEARLGMSVLMSITRARQLCCSPLLMPGGATRPMTPYGASLKTRAIVDKARGLVDQGKRIIVFSSWTGHLDIIASAMHSMEIRTVQYDGRMSRKDKTAAEAAFKAGEADVILMTTKSGGRALDFNEADAVFFADPWWNPKVERQGIGRATRRGQDKTILVYRFLTASPVESRIMKIHHRKDRLSELLKPGQIVETTSTISLDDMAELLEMFAVASDELRMAA